MSRNYQQSDDFRRQVQRDLAHDDAVKEEAKRQRPERVRVVLKEEEIPY